jgi:hypothetical protein
MSSEKIEAFWENATADDVARVMAGETVEARFRDDDHCGYTEGILAGWTKGDPSWLFSDQAHGQSYFETCQVYREPSWWTDKPDPGPGFRLLEKFPDEELKPGDDAWDVWNDKQWRMSDSANGRLPQGKDIWYRRRLEPVEPEPKHCVLRVGDSASLPNGQTITITEKGFEVTQ